MLRETLYLKSKCYNSLALTFLPIYSFQDTIPQILHSQERSNKSFICQVILWTPLIQLPWCVPVALTSIFYSCLKLISIFYKLGIRFFAQTNFYTINVYMMIFDLLHSIFVLLPIPPTGAVDLLFPILPCCLLFISDEGIVEEEGG